MQVRDPATALADSLRALRAARSAQTSFESFRRRRLPPGDAFDGPCDIHIGRYCYWRGDDDNADDDNPPVEAADIRARREKLIQLLDSLSDRVPGDAWLAGQRVRYLVEAGRASGALHFASADCHADASWCASLGGYAAQLGERFAEADSAYRVALAAMDPAQRCRWLDLSDDLDDGLADRFKSVPCADREAFVRRLAWYGAPLYSVSPTDLLTEHLARLTRARIAEHSATTDGEAWGDDVRELTVRYGWSHWYTRADPPLGSQRDPSYTGHDVGHAYDFLPSVRAVDSLGMVTAADWHLDDPRASTGYAPAYARSIHAVPNQIAVFRRGDSTLVVAAWDARRDTTLIGRALDAALVLTTGPDAVTIARRADAGAVGRIWVEGVADSAMASLEL
ncbi:MAG: hypothetical protein ACREMU_10290, partial [Gemmatimonadaceae bacterium]